MTPEAGGEHCRWSGMISGDVLKNSMRFIDLKAILPKAEARLWSSAAIAEPFLTHGLGGKAEARDKTMELLQRVGLSPDMAGRNPSQFSGGQRQRICIARALSLGPKIIIADESVSALDVSIKAQVVNLMMGLQEQFGLAYLFISRDMAVVERISHQVAVMYLGEIVEKGPVKAVFGNPQHPYAKRLLAAVPVPDPAGGPRAAGARIARSRRAVSSRFGVMTGRSELYPSPSSSRPAPAESRRSRLLESLLSPRQAKPA